MSRARVCPRTDRTVFHTQRGVALPALCNAWRCRACGGRKRDKLARRAKSMRADGLLTTTISDAHTDGLDATSLDAVAFLQERERVFRRHIVRELGGFGYLWVVEVGEEGGRVHRHYLVRWNRRALVSGFRRGWLPLWMLKRLQAFALSAGLGRIDWLPLENDRAASFYVAKYVTKTLAELGDGAPVRFRRFGSNRHYEEPKEQGWRSIGLPVDTVNRLLGAPPLAPATRDYWLLPESSLPPRSPPLRSWSLAPGVSGSLFPRVATDAKGLHLLRGLSIIPLT